jgi:MoaA/NifB/PqqE/SkfB family radical SAM enzyme
MEMKSIKWDVTGNCNLRCIHCCTGDKYIGENNKELSLEEKFKILDRLAEGGVTSVNLLGGEPLLLGDDFFSIIDYGVSKGIQMTSNTNGLLLNNNSIKKLADTGLSGLTISIEGPSSKSHDAVRGKGTFKKVISNVKNLTKYLSEKNISMNLTVNTVLNRQNYYNIEKMVDLCLDLKVNKLSLLQLGYVGFAKKNTDNLVITTKEIIDTAIRVARRVDPRINNLDNLIFENRFTYLPVSNFISKEYGFELPTPQVCCTGSLTFGFVDPYGNMFACERIPNDGHIGSKIGSATIKTNNLLNHTFYEIWNSKYFLEMFSLILDDATYQNYEPCNRCKYLKIGICTPCPLYSLNKQKVTIDECLFVEDKLGDLSNLVDGKQIENLQQVHEEFKEDVQNTALEALKFKYPLHVDGIRSYKKKNIKILFNPYTSNFSELNWMGIRIWDVIDGNKSIHEIFLEFCEEIKSVPISKDQFEKKVEYFFYALSKKGLITLCDV